MNSKITITSNGNIEVELPDFDKLSVGTIWDVSNVQITESSAVVINNTANLLEVVLLSIDQTGLGYKDWSNKFNIQLSDDIVVQLDHMGY